MIIGVPQEVKDHEARVGLLAERSAKALTEAGHRVLVQEGAGLGSSLPNSDYADAGAEIVPEASDASGVCSDLVVKVKEPQPSEYGFLRPDLILFTYLHLAPLPELTERLLDAQVTAVAYETIREGDGSLPAAYAHERSGRPHGSSSGRAIFLRRPAAAAVFCWVAYRGWLRPTWSFWAAGWSATRRRKWPWDSART